MVFNFLDDGFIFVRFLVEYDRTKAELFYESRDFVLRCLIMAVNDENILALLF